MTAGEDLTAKAGYLAEIRNVSGVANIFLPNSLTDYAFYLITDDGAINTPVTAEPFEPSRTHRVVLKGTANPGDSLVLADPSVAADRGKLRALPAVSGTYRVLAIAEEAGVDGQRVLARPVPVGNVTV